MKIKPYVMGVIIFVLLFGGIAVSSLLGHWVTQNTKVPAKYETGEFAGSYNPDDIRGSYTFEEISRLFDIPLEVLGKAFYISNDVNLAEFQCKELESSYSAPADEVGEIGTDSVRVFVALYKGLPIELDGAYLPKSAVDILELNSISLTEEQSKYLDEHSINMEAYSSSSIQKNESVSNSEEESENVINGSTTFAELVRMGLTEEEIEAITGFEIEGSGDNVRDYCKSKGLAFSDIKTKLQDIIDNKK